MWKKLPPVSKKELADLRGSKKIRLYADEDIEEEVVELDPRSVARRKGIDADGDRRGEPLVLGGR